MSNYGDFPHLPALDEATGQRVTVTLSQADIGAALLERLATTPLGAPPFGPGIGVGPSGFATARVEVLVNGVPYSALALVRLADLPAP